MEVLVWHQELGSDDDAATEEESVARVLYFWPPSSRSEQLSVLQLLQGAHAFAASFGEAKEDTIVELTGRTYCYYECEPHCLENSQPRLWVGAFSGMPMHREDVCNEKTMEIILHDMYKTFRLVHGSVDWNLQCRNNEDVGMDILKQIAKSRKLLRKASSRAVQVENDSDSSAFNAALEEIESLKVSIAGMEDDSPLPRFRAKCDDFFPTYLKAIDFNHLVEAKGIVYHPADKNIQLTLQLMLQSLLAEVPYVISTAAFLHGKMAWSQIPLSDLCTIYNFLLLREYVGYFSLNKASTPSSSSLWIKSNEKRSFHPIWAPPQDYEENDPTPSPKRRLSARDILSGNFKDDSTSKTSGFQCNNGTFTSSWKDAAIWSPSIFCPSFMEATCEKLIVWHEKNLTLLFIIKSQHEVPDVCHGIVKFLDRYPYLKQIDRHFPIANSILLPSSTPFVHYNHLTFAVQTNNLGKMGGKLKAGSSLLPLHFLPPSIPPAIKRVLDEARSKLSKDEHILDLCVKTPSDGWVVIRRTGTLGRDLYAFFNANVDTIEDLSLGMTELILDSFQDTFM